MDNVGAFSNLSEEECLAKISKEISRVLIPNTVFLALCIFLESWVTLLSCLCTLFDWARRKRVDTLSLALVDAFSVSFDAGFNLSFNLFPVNYNEETLCKCGWFFGYLTTIMSVILLPVIAVQCFLKICRPLGLQMLLPWKRGLVFLAFIGSLILSVPSYFTYGLDLVEIKEVNITGNAGRRLTSVNWKTFSLIHSAVFTSLSAVVVCVLLVLYVKLGKKSLISATQHQIKTQLLGAVNKKNTD